MSVLLLIRNIWGTNQEKRLIDVVWECCFFLIAPALIGSLYALYNYVRFDNPIEFGHNYLPEFVNSSYGQFSLRYFPTNLINFDQCFAAAL